VTCIASGICGKKSLFTTPLGSVRRSRSPKRSRLDILAVAHGLERPCRKNEASSCSLWHPRRASFGRTGRAGRWNLRCWSLTIFWRVLKQEPDRPVQGRAGWKLSLHGNTCRSWLSSPHSRRQARKQSWMQATAGDGVSSGRLLACLLACLLELFPPKQERRSGTGLMFRSAPLEKRHVGPRQDNHQKSSLKTHESARLYPRLPLESKLFLHNVARGCGKGVSIETREGLTRGRSPHA